MDNRHIDLIAAYEEALDIPKDKRTTIYYDEWNSYIIKGEDELERARGVRDEALKVIGQIRDDFEGDDRFADMEYIRAEVEKATRSIRISKEAFEVVEMFNKPVLFTVERLNSSDIPSDMYKYDIRDDGVNGNMVELKNYVTVNHWGTIICKEQFTIIKNSDGQEFNVGDGIPMTQDDYNFTGDRKTIEEYVDSYDELLNEIQNEQEESADGMSGMGM